MAKLYSTKLFLYLIIVLVAACSTDDTVTEIDTERCLVEINGNFEDIELDEDPEYLAGGRTGFLTNFYRVILYPAEARETGVEGVVILQYDITIKGTVEGIVILENPGAGLGEASVRALELTTEGMSFSQGLLNNIPVRVRKRTRVKFSLD